MHLAFHHSARLRRSARGAVNSDASTKDRRRTVEPAGNWRGTASGRQPTECLRALDGRARPGSTPRLRPHPFPHPFGRRRVDAAMPQHLDFPTLFAAAGIPLDADVAMLEAELARRGWRVQLEEPLH